MRRRLVIFGLAILSTFAGAQAQTTNGLMGEWDRSSFSSRILAIANPAYWEGRATGAASLGLGSAAIEKLEQRSLWALEQITKFGGAPGKDGTWVPLPGWQSPNCPKN